jgi:hypothetical protein
VSYHSFHDRYDILTLLLAARLSLAVLMHRCNRYGSMSFPLDGASPNISLVETPALVSFEGDGALCSLVPRDRGAVSPAGGGG